MTGRATLLCPRFSPRLLRRYGNRLIADDCPGCHRDALRILFSIHAGGEPFSDTKEPDIVSIFKGETRLWAFDF
jgi:hypothetical protein